METDLANFREVDVKDVFDALKRQRVWVVGLPLAFLTLAVAYTMTTRPAYTAIAQVYVDPRERRTPKDDALRDAVPGDGLLLVESQLKIITSDEVLKRVVEKAHLDKDPEFDGSRSGFIRNILATFGFGKRIDPKLAALRNLRLKTASKRIDRSFVIDIMGSADTSERAVEITNALAASYLEDQADADAKFNRRVSESINTQLENLRSALTRSEDAVAAYKAENNLVGSRSGLVNEQQLGEANTQLTHAKTRLAEAQARLRLIDSIRRGTAGLETLPEAIQSGTIIQLRARAADLAREEAQLASLNGPLHPALRAVQAQRRELQATIKNEVDRIAQSVRNSAAGESANVQDLQNSFNALKAQAQANEKLLVPLRQLERTAEANRTIYENFLAKAKAAEQQQIIDKNNIRLITKATPPEQKSWPPTFLILAAALFLGVLLGVPISLTRDYLASRDKKKAADSLGVESEDIETQLSYLVDDLIRQPPGHAIFFVQLVRDPSMDFFALEVARELRHEDSDVLFVDADLKSRKNTRLLGLENRSGLTNLLSGAAPPEAITRYHKKLDIEVMPAGTGPTFERRPSSWKALARAIESARPFDNVVIDGGAIEHVSYYLGISALVDEFVILVSGTSRHADDLKNLIDTLEKEVQQVRVLLVKETKESDSLEAA